MAFHEERFPTDLSFGAVGGPERRTEIVTLANGYEERNTSWAHSRRRYDAGLGLRSLEDVEQLIAFFEARRGQLHGFRWKDWADFSSAPAGASPNFEDQPIGIGDGMVRTFQLSKRYGWGDGAYQRPIAKPVIGSVRAGWDGAEVDGFVVEDSTGKITFDIPPAAGTTVTAGFLFDVPVRFDTDRIDVSLATFNAGHVPDVPVVELRV